MSRSNRTIISAGQLDRHLTARLHRSGAFETVRVSAGYRLRVPDASGCNWSGRVVPIHGLRAPAREIIEAALRPIVEAARARFNLSE
ncbi:MAG: hypothetical protein WAK94_08600 [Steroidobacteraceae bacterium]